MPSEWTRRRASDDFENGVDSDTNLPTVAAAKRKTVVHCEDTGVEDGVEFAVLVPERGTGIAAVSHC